DRTATRPPRLAVFNYASATFPGDDFLGGARAPLTSTSPSSAPPPTLLYRPQHPRRPALLSRDASHAQRSLRARRPGVWASPADVEALTSAAVNVNSRRQSLYLRGGKEAQLPADVAAEAAAIMREGMARILCAMARAGAFRNNVDFVPKTWAELLCDVRAPFRDVF
ncbi:hypothetical protein B0H19DRAFT_871999, partial [Mycena capillaripes]